MKNEELRMKNEKKAWGDFLYSLMPLEKFKAVLGVDDRDDKMCRFCLVTATLTIEEYCRRRLLSTLHNERIEYVNDECLVLREYPVQKIKAIRALYHFDHSDLIEPEFYKIVPDEKSHENFPYMIILSPFVKRLRSLAAFRVIYNAGYRITNEELKMKNEKWREDTCDLYGVPGDLAAACLELAAWNMNRYRGRRIGMTGNIRGSGRDGEHFELSMPENVRGLLEPYRRKVI